MYSTLHKPAIARLSVSAKILICLMAVFALSRTIPAIAQQRQFRAGAATSNITPWLGISSNGGMQDRVPQHVHDELHARALVLDDGQTRLAVVTVDSCMVPRQILDAAKKLVQLRSGLPIENMLMSATHTHTAGTATPVFQSEADAEYQLFLTRKIADSVRIALSNLEPARVGWGVGAVPQHVFNRRWKMKPGTIPPNPFGGTDQVKMNPAAGSPDLLEPAGPTNPDLAVISVRALDGRVSDGRSGHSAESRTVRCAPRRRQFGSHPETRRGGNPNPGPCSGSFDRSRRR
jgi:hypothetical protein